MPRAKKITEEQGRLRCSQVPSTSHPAGVAPAKMQHYRPTHEDCLTQSLSSEPPNDAVERKWALGIVTPGELRRLHTMLAYRHLSHSCTNEEHRGKLPAARIWCIMKSAFAVQYNTEAQQQLSCQ